MFQQQHTLEDRQAQSERIRKRYVDRVAVIVERSAHEKILPQIAKYKYLVPHDLTLGQFVYVIRKQLTLRTEDSLFVFVNGKLPPASTTMSELYRDYRDLDDSFVYCCYAGMQTYG